MRQNIISIQALITGVTHHYNQRIHQQKNLLNGTQTFSSGKLIAIYANTLMNSNNCL